MENNKVLRNKLDNNYIVIILIWLTALVTFYIAGKTEGYFYSVFSIIPFLNLHTIMEFITIIISFALFIITYYTYSKNLRLRLLIYSSVFFVVGSIDFLHTMNYYGMQGLFGASSISRATTFWMISRLIMALGIFFASLIPYNKTVNHKRRYYLMGSILSTFILFYLVSFRIDLFPPMFIKGSGLTPLKINLEYFIMLLFTIAAILSLYDYKRTKERVFIIFAAGLSFSVFTEAAFTMYRSVYDTYNLLGHIHKIISFYLIFRSIFIFNLDAPYKQLGEARKKLKLYVDNLEVIVKKRTSEIQQAHEKMMEDLEYAKTIQQSLLPPKSLNIYNVRFISDFIPCQSLSGDFYHMYPIDHENIGMFIADVAGHGVSAAMMTVFTERLLNPANRGEKGDDKLSPEKTLQYLYEEFNKSNYPDEMHIVGFKAIYNIKSRNLIYCSGGLNTQPILVRKNGEILFLDKSKGFPICKLNEFFTPVFESSTIKLNRGDRVLFYTDGLVDGAKNSTMLKKEVLIKMLETSRDYSLDDLNTKFNKTIQKVIEKKLNEKDDITYFIMEV